MEPNNNIENQFKQKLNQRTIEPSDKAWDRLDAMLSVSEKKKSKRTWLWMAASLLVFAAIGSLFLRTDNSELMTNYETEVRRSQLQVTNDELITNNEIITDPTPEIVIDEENFALIERELDEKTIPQDSFRIVQNVGIFNSNNNSNGNSNFNDNFNNQNIDAEIADTNIDTEFETNTYITAQELLSEISDEKYTEEPVKKTAVSINHKSLLYQAEMEVETQYRKNAIDRFLQKSYDDVRVVVINKF